MRRQKFRLGSVLRYYKLQKDRSEYALQQASRVLRDIDAAIDRFGVEIASVAAILTSNAASLTTSGWIACYRKTEYLGKQLAMAREQRKQQVIVVAKLSAERKRWSIAEETLLSLKQGVADFNHAEAAKSHQLQLDDTVLRQWIGLDED